MKKILPPVRDNPRQLARRLGYAEFQDPKTGQISFVRRLSANFYPRFHLYLEEKDGRLVANLHLDQKKPSYEGCRAHSGEYDGETVEREGRRIKETLNSEL